MQRASKRKHTIACAAAWLVSSLLCGAANAADGSAPEAPPGAATGADQAPDGGAAEAAGPDSEGGTPHEAEALVEGAIRRRREGDDEGALRLLEKARALAPDSARVQIHLASVHQALGNWVAAEVLLAQVLGRRGDGYVERNRELLDRALDAVNAHLGQLAVAGSPIGAAVRLDGRALGVLPLAGSVKATVGTHVLEVDAGGYWPMARSIEVHAHETRQESIELRMRHEPDRADALRAEGDEPGISILTWTLAGAATTAAIGSVFAWGVREQHAQRWNANDCLPFGSTRERVCGSEREAAQRYQALAITGGIGAGLLGAGAVLSAWFRPNVSPKSHSAAGLRGCDVGLTGLGCHGRF